MKKIFLLTILILFSLFIFSETTSISINIQSLLKNNNYRNFNDALGTPYIDYKIVFNNRININNIDFTIISNDSVNVKFKQNNYDISLDGKDSILLEAPHKHIEILNKGYSGYNTIIVLRIFPIIYDDKGMPSFVSSFNVNIDYSEKEFNRKKSKYDNIYNRFDKNTYIVDIYNEPKDIEYASCDMLIITKTEFEKVFTSYLQYSNLTGVRTELYTLEYIENNYTGADVQEKIRNFIKFMYLTKGIHYVVLGGDVNVVPVRMVYNNSYYYYGYLPSDMYYADMDGTWNADRDGVIGELQEDSIDAYPELVVTRIPCETIEEFNTFFNKITEYTFNNNINNINKFLLVGASLAEDQSDGSGQLINNLIASQTNTYNFDYYSLYGPVTDTFNDTPQWNGDEELNKNSFINQINNGYYFINHIDHSNEFWMGTGMYSSQTEFFNIDSIYWNNTSSTYSVMFTMGCEANGFDRECITEVLINSSKSPIVNITGFTRTGWTSSNYFNKDFWNQIADNITNYVGDGFFIAQNNCTTQYFRVGISMLGIPNLIVFHGVEREITLIGPDTVYTNYIALKTQLDGVDMGDIEVNIMDSKNYYTDVSGGYGDAVFDNTFTDSILYLGAWINSGIPCFDTIYFKKPNLISITNVYQNTNEKDNFIFIIKNNTDTIIRDINFNVTKSDSLFLIDYSETISLLEPSDSAIINAQCLYYKDPVYNCDKLMKTTVSNSNATFINDSTFITLSKNSFEITNFTCIDNDLAIIDTIGIYNNSEFYLNNVQIIIKSTNDSIIVKDSIFNTAIPEMDTIYLTDIGITGNITKNDIINSEYEIIISQYNREYSFNITGKTLDSIAFNAQFKMNGVYLYNSLKNTKGYIYSSISAAGPYELIDSFDFDRNIVIDTNYSNNTIYYFADFYDNASRFIKRSDTLEIKTPFKMKKSNTILSGSYYGKLNGVRFYAKSSFNLSDLNNDLIEEYIVIGDDGHFYILNNNLEDITPFTLFINKNNETTPAIADIDNNGEKDIVISGGYSSDTTAVIIFNPFSNYEIKIIQGYGRMFASPVIYDINDYDGKEILIGTTDGFYVFNKDLNEIISLRKNYINISGIAVAGDKEFIAILDYYGHLDVFDYNGNEKSGFPYNIGEITPAPFIMGDIDNDNIVDIAIGTASSNLYVIDENANVKNNFPYAANAPFYQSPRFVDFNNDNVYNIIIMDYNGNIYNIDNSGNALIYTTNTASNTYNEPIIADINSDGKSEIISISNNGIYFVIDENCTLIDSMNFNRKITSTPIISHNNYYMTMTFKDVGGNIISFNYKYIAGKSSIIIPFPKTLYDENNSSYVKDVLLKYEEDNFLRRNTSNFEYIKISNSFIKNTVKINYSIKENKVPVIIYNKIGMLVYKTELNNDENTKFIPINRMKISAGEYFVRINYDNKVYSKKILIIK